MWDYVLGDDPNKGEQNRTYTSRGMQSSGATSFVGNPSSMFQKAVSTFQEPSNEMDVNGIHLSNEDGSLPPQNSLRVYAPKQGHKQGRSPTKRRGRPASVGKLTKTTLDSRSPERDDDYERRSYSHDRATSSKSTADSPEKTSLNHGSSHRFSTKQLSRSPATLFEKSDSARLQTLNSELRRGQSPSSTSQLSTSTDLNQCPPKSGQNATKRSARAPSKRSRRDTQSFTSSQLPEYNSNKPSQEDAEVATTQGKPTSLQNKESVRKLKYSPNNNFRFSAANCHSMDLRDPYNQHSEAGDTPTRDDGFWKERMDGMQETAWKTKQSVEACVRPSLPNGDDGQQQYSPISRVGSDSDSGIPPFCRSLDGKASEQRDGGKTLANGPQGIFHKALANGPFGIFHCSEVSHAAVAAEQMIHSSRKMQNSLQKAAEGFQCSLPDAQHHEVEAFSKEVTTSSMNRAKNRRMNAHSLPRRDAQGARKKEVEQATSGIGILNNIAKGIDAFLDPAFSTSTEEESSMDNNTSSMDKRVESSGVARPLLPQHDCKSESNTAFQTNRLRTDFSAYVYKGVPRLGSIAEENASLSELQTNHDKELKKGSPRRERGINGVSPMRSREQVQVILQHQNATVAKKDQQTITKLAEHVAPVGQRSTRAWNGIEQQNDVKTGFFSDEDSFDGSDLSERGQPLLASSSLLSLLSTSKASTLDMVKDELAWKTNIDLSAKKGAILPSMLVSSVRRSHSSQDSSAIEIQHQHDLEERRTNSCTVGILGRLARRLRLEKNRIPRESGKHDIFPASISDKEQSMPKRFTNAGFKVRNSFSEFGSESNSRSFDMSFAEELKAGMSSESVTSSGVESLYEYENDTGIQMRVVYHEYGRDPENQIGVFQYDTPLMESFVGRKNFVVKVDASTVSETDCAIRSGYFSSDLKFLFPITPGVAISGVVYNVDEDSSKYYDFKVGDRVVSLMKSGGNARYISLDPSHVVKVPADDLDPGETVCLVETYLSAFQLLHASQAKGGTALRYHSKSLRDITVLVLGGLLLNLERAITEIGYICGCTNMFVASKHSGFDVVEEMGVTVLDADSTLWQDHLQNSVDIVLHLGGGLSQSLVEKVLKPAGCLVILSSYTDAQGPFFSKVPTRGSLAKAEMDNKIIRYNIFKAWDLHCEQAKDDLRFLLDLQAGGLLKPFVIDRLPLSKVGEAQQRLETNLQSGFIVCEPWLLAKSKSMNL